MSQILIRHLDDTLVQQLRVKAAKDGVSVEDGALELLREAMQGAPTTMPETAAPSAQKDKPEKNILADPHSNPRNVLA
jgi:plasmid stability protein